MFFCEYFPASALGRKDLQASKRHTGKGVWSWNTDAETDLFTADI